MFVIFLGGSLWLGGFSFYWGTTEYSLSRQSLHWPFTSGRILTSYVSERVGRNGPWPIIHYEYRVNGKKFKSHIIQFGQNGSTRQHEAAATVARYKVGDVTRVYYNPHWPQQACLEPGTFQSEASLSIVGGAAIIATVLAVLIAKLIIFSVYRSVKSS